MLIIFPQVTKPFGRTVKLLRKVKNLRSGSTMNRWLVSFGHGLGSGAFDRRELPDMEMEEDCFRKLVSSEVFAPKSAQVRRSHSDEQKTNTTAAADDEKFSLGKAVEDSLTHEAKVEAAVEAEAAAETAAAPPQQQNLQLSDDSAESSPRSENANYNNGANHKRKVSHGSSTSSPLDNSEQQPPAKKLCPALKSEEPPTKADAMDEERTDASTSGRDEQPQPPQAEELSHAPPAPAPPITEEVEAKKEAETEVEVETPMEEEKEPVVESPFAGATVEEVETKVEMDVERTPDLKSVHSDEAKETEDNGDGDEVQHLTSLNEEVSSAPSSFAPSPPPTKEELPINVAMEEEMASPPEEDAPQPVSQPETGSAQPETGSVHSDTAKENEDTGSINRKRSSSGGDFSSSSNKISEEPTQFTTDTAPKPPTPTPSPKAPSPPPSPKTPTPPPSPKAPTPPPSPKAPTPPPSPKAPTPPPMLLAHDLLAKAKLAKKLSQKPISLQQLKQQARAKVIEKAMQHGKGGKKQKRKGERKSRRYQKVPPSKPQTSEAEASTNSSDEAEENVEKIVMNTGTLYLYRGDNPRAEFIRRK